MFLVYDETNKIVCHTPTELQAKIEAANKYSTGRQASNVVQDLRFIANEVGTKGNRIGVKLIAEGDNAKLDSKVIVTNEETLIVITLGIKKGQFISTAADIQKHIQKSSLIDFVNVSIAKEASTIQYPNEKVFLMGGIDKFFSYDKDDYYNWLANLPNGFTISFPCNIINVSNQFYKGESVIDQIRRLTFDFGLSDLKYNPVTYHITHPEVDKDKLENAQNLALTQLRTICSLYIKSDVIRDIDMFNKSLDIYPAEECWIDSQRHNIQRVRHCKYRHFKSIILQATLISEIPNIQKKDLVIPLDKWFLAYRDNGNCFYFGQDYIKAEAIRRYELGQIKEPSSLALERAARLNKGVNGKFKELNPVKNDLNVATVDSMPTVQYLRDKISYGFLIEDFHYDVNTEQLSLDEYSNLSLAKGRKIHELSHAWDRELFTRYPTMDMYTLLRKTCGKTDADQQVFEKYLDDLYLNKFLPKKALVEKAATKTEVLSIRWDT